MLVLYCTGISHPANGTILAPRDTWKSYKPVLCSPFWNCDSDVENKQFGNICITYKQTKTGDDLRASKHKTGEGVGG